MLTRRAAVVAMVAVLVAVAGCRKPFDGCRKATLTVDRVSVSGARPSVHLRARFTDARGNALPGAKVQFLLQRVAGESEQPVGFAEARTDADGVADADYGATMLGSDLIRRQAADAHVLHAYVDTTLTTLSDYCDTQSDAAFEYRP
jgi:hypothetical protein